MAADAATFTTGEVLVTTPGTRVQLSASTAILSEGVYLRSRVANTGKIYWGNGSVTSANGVELGVNESVFIPCKYPSAVYIDAQNAGEGVRYALI